MDYPTSFQATDTIVINRQAKVPQFLLGKKDPKKHKTDKWRFLGGFVDPKKDNSLEDASKRERLEEAGMNLECSDPQYLFSFRVDDPRYRKSEHKIMSAVFLHEYIFGFAKAGDDIKETEWFPNFYIRANYQDMVVEEHWPIVERLIEQGMI